MVGSAYKPPLREGAWHRLDFLRQLVLLALLPIILLTIVVMVLIPIALSNITRDLVLQRNQSIVSLTASSISQDILAQMAPLQAAAASLAPVVNDAAVRQNILQQTEPFLQSFEGGVTLMDRSGVAVASSSNAADRIGLNYSFRDYFQAVLREDKPVFSSALLEQPSGQLAVVIAVPVGGSQPPDGVLVGVYFLQRHLWPNEIEMLQAQEGRQALLVDANGTILYAPASSSIGKALSEPGLLEAAHSGQSQSFLFKTVEHGETWVAAYAPLQSLGWGILLEEPWDPLLDPARPYLVAMGVALLVSLIVAVLILLGGLRSLIRPVVALMNASRRVSEGEAFQPLEEQGPAETRLLVRTFNQMVQRLDEQQMAVRRYALQVLRSQEEERVRISRDLHDETVQDLVGLGQRLELLRNALVRDPAGARQRIEELQVLTSRALADVRRMSNDLRPTLLEDLGLMVAVQRLCENIEDDLPSAQVEFSVSGHERRLTTEVELITYRVIQETLNNIRKHARSASHIQVTLNFAENELSARVSDDGPGFQYGGIAELMSQGHLGLAGMVERAGLMQGKLTLHTQLGAGVQVELCLPV
jgi:signal transduction histidine kinase